MPKFFIALPVDMSSHRPHFDTNSIIGGNKRDNDVEPIDPINDIIKLKSGTNSAITTVNNSYL